ncbi:MAG: hypothetical protein DMF84_25250 [Acidobacteria bacterium]|nr:MAG: hypothetical protein DMF84_25250 [Acidobacteriota bacterium]
MILTSLQAAPGNKPGSLGSFLLSDVRTVVDNVPTTFNDVGQASFELALKDAGPTGSANAPSQNNGITLTQYHVQYVRSDGHNTPGVDVPFAFDGALTQTVSAAASVGFTLVRNQAKSEAPLQALVLNNIPFTVVAQVTFYGHDQTGHEVSVSGNIEITFADFGD